MAKKVDLLKNNSELAAGYFEASELLAAILDIGELLLMNGAEAQRVEDTITRICGAYECRKIDVFCIASAITVTVHMKNGVILTQTRRIASRGTNLGLVELLNALSRKICVNTVSLAVLKEELLRLKNAQKYSNAMLCMMYGIISFAFTIFFGGRLIDGLCSFTSGILLYLLLFVNFKIGLNNILQTVLCSAGTAAYVIILSRFVSEMQPDKVMIGNIMLVIPGVLLTTSLRDVINGDLITGVLGICEAIITAVAVALGFVSVMYYFGG